MCFDFFRARIHFSQLHLSANAQLTSHFTTLEKYRSFDRLLMANEPGGLSSFYA